MRKETSSLVGATVETEDVIALVVADDKLLILSDLSDRDEAGSVLELIGSGNDRFTKSSMFFYYVGLWVRLDWDGRATMRAVDTYVYDHEDDWYVPWFDGDAMVDLIEEEFDRDGGRLRRWR